MISYGDVVLTIIGKSRQQSLNLMELIRGTRLDYVCVGAEHVHDVNVQQLPAW